VARIRIEKLIKQFGKVIAVNNLSLEVRDKEFLVLLGPSGCGKTTVLRCIAGLERQDSGDIYIGDNLVNDVPPQKRNVAMVFQSYALYPHMKVYDIMALPLKIRKVSKDEIEKTVKRTAELLRISHLLERRPGQLSGGERQRVALGRVIVREPECFLMDEPLSNVDAKLRTYMRAELKRLQRELRITTIYVTHDQVEALTMSDRIAIMNRGELQQVGSPEDIYDKPVNTFVGGFIGSPPMNFIEGTFFEKEGAFFLDIGTFILSVSKEIGDIINRKASSSRVILGIRPEDILLNKDRKAEKDAEAEVYVVEPLGSELIVDLDLSGNLIRAKAPRDFKVNIGESLGIRFNMNKAHFFDKTTEKVIV